MLQPQLAESGKERLRGGSRPPNEDWRRISSLDDHHFHPDGDADFGRHLNYPLRTICELDRRTTGIQGDNGSLGCR